MKFILFQDDISAIFEKADKNKSGTLKVDDFKEVVNDIIERYPQVELYLKKKQMNNFVELLKSSHPDEELDIEKFKAALSEVDSQMKVLPATAQVCTFVPIPSPYLFYYTVSSYLRLWFLMF